MALTEMDLEVVPTGPDRSAGADAVRLLPLLAVLVFAGCSVSIGGDGSSAVMWDLSGTNDIAALDWPDDRPTGIGRDQGTDVTVRLPGGKEFKGDVRVEAFRGDDDEIDRIGFTHPPMALDDAYRLAVELAHRFDVDTARLDAWYARRQVNDDRSDTDFTSSQDSGPLVPGGPSPSIEVRNSFNAERPVSVGFGLTWDTR